MRCEALQHLRTDRVIQATLTAATFADEMILTAIYNSLRQETKTSTITVEIDGRLHIWKSDK